jgi:hypothetical protein
LQLQPLVQLEPLRAKFWTHCYLASSTSLGRLLLGFWRLPLGFGHLVQLGLVQLEPLRAKFWTHCYLASSTSLGRLLLGLWRLPLGFGRLLPLGFWRLPLVGLLASTTGLRALAQTSTVYHLACFRPYHKQPQSTAWLLVLSTTAGLLASTTGHRVLARTSTVYHWACFRRLPLGFWRLPLGLLLALAQASTA